MTKFQLLLLLLWMIKAIVTCSVNSKTHFLQARNYLKLSRAWQTRLMAVRGVHKLGITRLCSFMSVWILRPYSLRWWWRISQNFINLKHLLNTKICKVIKSWCWRVLYSILIYLKFQAEQQLSLYGELKHFFFYKSYRNSLINFSLQNTFFSITYFTTSTLFLCTIYYMFSNKDRIFEIRGCNIFLVTLILVLICGNRKFWPF